MKKQKILYIIEQMERGGAEKVLQMLCMGLHNKGYIIEIIAFSKIQSISMPSYVNVHCFGLAPFRIQNKRIYFSYKKMNALRKLIREIQPNIIHSHINNHKIINLLCTYNRNIKYFNTIHTFCSHYQNKHFSLNWLLEKITYNILNCSLIAVSPELYIKLATLYAKNRVHLITNGIYFDPNENSLISRDANRQKLGIDSKDFVIVHVGRFHIVKDHLTIVKAIAILRNQIPNIRVLFIGERGGEFKNIVQQIRILGLEKTIFCIGEVDNVFNYLTLSDIGVFPSKQEGLSIAILEMMQAALPTVVTNIPSFQYIFDGIKYAQFIEVGDATALAEKILFLKNNKSIAIELGNNSFQKVSSKFSLVEQINKHIQLYQN